MSNTGDTTPRRRKPRSDGEQNRERLLVEAETLFGEQGTNAPLDELVRRADVSSATFYRHFATREDLILALDARHGERVDRALNDRVLVAPSASEQLELLVVLGAELLIDYPSARPVMIAAARLEPANGMGERFEAPIIDIVARAKAEGALREDVDPTDIPLAVMMIGSFGSLRGMRESGLWRRYAGFVIDGMRPAGWRLSAGETSAPDLLEIKRLLGPEGESAI
ncbi:TetR/AcrR family transcriptional regulator [soil metagenome]